MTTTLESFMRSAEAEATGVTSPLKRAHRRVLEQPGDDTARLWYADELDAVGEVERAEFIRVQCRLADENDTPWTAAEVVHAMDVQSRTFKSLECRKHPPLDAFPCFYSRPFYDGPPHTRSNSAVLFQRGFASELRCTLAQFMGNDCRQCAGSGLSEREYQGVTDNDGGCPTCHGTGRTPGLVDTLFSEHPVTEVILTDREPRIDTDTRSGSQVFWWAFDNDGRARREGYAHVIDRPICNMVNNGQHVPINYPTREAALLALSAACVALGRRRAGLPELKPTEVTG